MFFKNHLPSSFCPFLALVYRLLYTMEFIVTCGMEFIVTSALSLLVCICFCIQTKLLAQNNDLKSPTPLYQEQEHPPEAPLQLCCTFPG